MSLEEQSRLPEPSPKEVKKPYSVVADVFIEQANLRKDDENALQDLENALVLEELKRREREESKLVLSPRLRRLAEEYKENIDKAIENGKAGGQYIFYGLPGTGKSDFAEYVLSTLDESYGVVRINASPSHRLEEQITASTEDIQIKASKDLISPPNDLDIMTELIELSVWTNAGSKKQLKRSWSRFSETVASPSGITLPDIEGGESSVQLAEIVKNASKDSPHYQGFVELLKSKLRRYRSLGPLGLAMELGFAVLADELEKEHINNVMSAGAGTEDVLATSVGKVIVRNRTSTPVNRGFVVMATANKVEDIAEWTKRKGRLEPKQFNLEAEDFFFAARVLLSNERGAYLFADEPTIDAALSTFLLWYKAFSTVPTGIQMNVIRELCLHLKTGSSFEQAITKSLDESALSVFQTFNTENNDESGLRLSQFTFSGLNSGSEKKSLDIPSTCSSFISQSEEGSVLHITYNKDNADQVVLSRELPKKATEVFALSPFAQRAVAKDEDHNLIFIDVPNGKEMPVAFLNKRFKEQGLSGIRDIEARFITDNKGLLYTQLDGTLYVFPFEIKPKDRSVSGSFTDPNKSEYGVNIINVFSFELASGTKQPVEIKDNTLTCDNIALSIQLGMFSTFPLKRHRV